MNRKQRYLTVIALIAFVVIGFCHYLAAKTYADYSSGRMVERTVIPTPAPVDVPDLNHFATFEDALAASERVPTPTPAPPVKIEERVPDIRWYLAWVHPSDSMVPDVRLPWFMLGVIYAGLFFLLADRKGARPEQ